MFLVLNAAFECFHKASFGFILIIIYGDADFLLLQPKHSSFKLFESHVLIISPPVFSDLQAGFKDWSISYEICWKKHRSFMNLSGLLLIILWGPGRDAGGKDDGRPFSRRKLHFWSSLTSWDKFKWFILCAGAKVWGNSEWFALFLAPQRPLPRELVAATADETFSTTTKN